MIIQGDSVGSACINDGIFIVLCKNINLFKYGISFVDIINKGYAYNKLIFLHKTIKYTIVDTGTSYGVALYDHIALDGSKIKENQLVVK